MMAGDRQVSTSRQVDTRQAGGKRRRWPEALKRQLVAETLEPGSSVSIVARRHDVNANQLFKWRHELGRSTGTEAALVPISVVPDAVTGPVLGPVVQAAAMPARIEIALTGGVRVRIEGAVDPAAVTAAIAAVMKARRRR
jgi:transposase